VWWIFECTCGFRMWIACSQGSVELILAVFESSKLLRSRREAQDPPFGQCRDMQIAAARAANGPQSLA